MKTHLILILDASGSINRRGGSIKSAVVESVGKLIAEQRKIGDDCTVQLVQFNSQITAGDVVPIADFRLNYRDYVTKGNTRLFDGICEAFDKSGQYLAGLPEEQRPQKVVAVIITDGLERGSVSHNREAVVQRVRHQTQVYNWQVILLQGNYSASESAAQLGIDPENAIRFTPTSGGVEAAMAKASNQTSNYRAGRGNSLAAGANPARIELANVVAS